MTKKIIGLTGGIATGKTTVANYLADAYNLPILDADIYAREAVCVGSPLLDAIATRYGKQILLPNGNLDRQKLGEIIFKNPEDRTWIENLIHPYVRDRFQAEIKASTVETLILVVPLLFEAGMTDLVTEIWVVWCSQRKQLARLMQRNHLTFEQAQARIHSQMPIAEKAARADVILDNSSTLEVLLKQVDAALTKL
ncbi:dephospho-CoA kinase [Fischerella thermalis]|uniref:dephospho-CoA kinase n=1 Tax=Fischerella thermalis TaxID=372787 RepID=UPI000C7FFEC9|nr:dephospho-CoA kinase [Fischerella thermalis]PLZ08805.1 dephospho-CoA kinase [Fischerella thermalis WC1110]PLZ42820.1 dephospho-CoA kinase [Fischerella thermalis WC527]PLZ43922.1 dephospho-CoA kinase [Fischerella thermalis WC538]